MSKLVALVILTLDGVSQAATGPDEDGRGAREHVASATPSLRCNNPEEMSGRGTFRDSIRAASRVPVYGRITEVSAAESNRSLYLLPPAGRLSVRSRREPIR